MAWQEHVSSVPVNAVVRNTNRKTVAQMSRC
jgi:hypothetical protein